MGLNAKLTLANITIDGNKAVVTNAQGSLVFVNGGTFTMNDGAILQNNTNTDSSGGGGVHVNGGTFTMSGGTISGNSATYGGGVYVYGTFTMSGNAKIYGNTISGSGSGCGVYVSSGTFTIGGNAKIYGNTLSGGTTANNVYLWSGKYITIGTGANAPNTSMEIWVQGSNGTVIVNSGATSGQEAYFKADDDSLMVALDGGSLKLVEKPKEPTPNAFIEYTAEKLTGLTANAVYIINGTDYTADTDGKIDIISGWFGTTLSIVKKGNGTTSVDGDAQSLDISVRSAAPIVTPNHQTTIGGVMSIGGTTAAMEYRKGTGAWTACTATATTVTVAGTYEVRYTAIASSFASAAASVTVNAYNATQEATPNAVIEYTAEKLTGLTISAAYKINGTDYTADASGKIDIISGWFGTTLSIVKKGNGTTTTDSNAQSLPIPARPTAPSPNKTNTTGGNSNGSITGVDNTMEYKLSTSATWTTISGTTVTGLSAGTYNVRVKATPSAFASEAASVTIAGSTPTPTPNPTPNPNPTPTPNPTPDPDPTPDTSPTDSTSAEPQAPAMIIDGKEVKVGTVTTEDDKTIVIINQETLNEQLETATDNVTITIPAETGTAVVELIMQNVDDMTNKDVTFTIQAGNVQYELPAGAIDTAAILESLGADSATGVELNITITTEVSPEVQAVIDSIMESNGGEVIIPPIEFKVTATYNGETVEISTFSQYVSRSVEVTEEQAQKITTAVVIEPDGTVRHVPTYVYEKDGKWYFAVISSLTNSTYVLIYNEINFADAKGKWYEDAANEMASRMVMPGVKDDEFGGEAAITRAEFTSVVIRALGLPENGSSEVFSDVSASAGYAGAVGKAYEYGLVSGVGDSIFAPDKNITRQEAMVIIMRAAKIAGFDGETGSIGTFSDVGNVSDWALEAVQWNVGSVLIAVSDGKLNPTDNITRGETAALVLNLLQKAGLIDTRTPQSTETAAVEPRKESEQITILDDGNE